AVCVVAHAKKAQAGDSPAVAPGQRLAGTTALHGWSEASIYFGAGPAGARRLAYELKDEAALPDALLRVETAPLPGAIADLDAPTGDGTGPLRLVSCDPPESSASARGEATAAACHAALAQAWAAAGRPAGGVERAAVAKAMGDHAPADRTLVRHLHACALPRAGQCAPYRYRPVEGGPDPRAPDP
ncbi:MAG: hypothetical protein HZA54_04255, partial [Planctomycetes bacterium]|nr:hypothetical protein [Planctomycetota bacterium]